MVSQVQISRSGLCGISAHEGSKNPRRCRGSVAMARNLIIECICECHAMSAFMRSMAGMPTTLLWGLPMWQPFDHYRPVAEKPVQMMPGWGAPVCIEVDHAKLESPPERWTPIYDMAQLALENATAQFAELKKLLRGKSAENMEPPRQVIPPSIALLMAELPPTISDPIVSLIAAPRAPLLSQAGQPSRAGEAGADGEERGSVIRDIAREIITPGLVNVFAGLGGIPISVIVKIFTEKHGYDVSPGALKNALDWMARFGEITMESSPWRITGAAWSLVDEGMAGVN